MPNQAEHDPSGAYVKSLACAILQQAVDDLAKPFTDPQVTLGKRKPFLSVAFQDAKEFLCQTGKDLEFWCNIVGLSPLAVVEQSKRSLRKNEQS